MKLLGSLCTVTTKEVVWIIFEYLRIQNQNKRKQIWVQFSHFTFSPGPWSDLIEKSKMSFGPQLPAHLRKPPQESESESDDDQSYGPRLPSVPCRGPKPAQNSG